MSSLFQRIVLAVTILEIPLQVEKYLLYHERDAEFGAVGGISISLMTFGLVVLYMLWLFEAATNPGGKRGRLIWGLPLLIYTAVVGLSVVASSNALLTLFQFVLLVQAYLLFFYIANRMQSRGDLIYLLSLLCVAVVMQGFIILGTTIGGPREFSIGMIDAIVYEDGRPCGTLSSPVIAGSFLALLVVPIGSLLLTPVSGRMKLLAMLAVILGSLAVVLTQTRGAILTVALAALIFGGCMFWRGWLPKWTPAAVLLMGALLAFPLLNVFKNRVQDGDGGSAEARFHHYGIAMELIQEKPLLGVGAGNCHLAARHIATGSPYRSEWFYTIHSKYLVVCVETGFVGLAAFMLFLLGTLMQGWRTWRVGDRLLSTVSLALVAGIAGQMTHMGADVFNSRQQVAILLCCAGIVVGLSRLAATSTVTAAEPTTPARRLRLAAQHGT